MIVTFPPKYHNMEKRITIPFHLYRVILDMASANPQSVLQFPHKHIIVTPKKGTRTVVIHLQFPYRRMVVTFKIVVDSIERLLQFPYKRIVVTTQDGIAIAKANLQLPHISILVTHLQREIRSINVTIPSHLYNSHI